MNKEQFIKTYCHKCGTQRCEGVGSEWFEGCAHRWNLDGMNPAAEIKKLNDEITKLGYKLIEATSTKHGHWIVKNTDDTACYVICSECGLETWYPIPDKSMLHNYCADCGAMMNDVVNAETNEKQYTITELSFCQNRVKLYHNGKFHKTEDIWLDNIDEYIEKIEADGYKLGYTEKEAEEAREILKDKLLNIIKENKM